MEYEVQVYDNAIVQKSGFSKKYLTSLANVAMRDYNNCYGFSDKVMALDMDAFETARNGNNDKTMDVAIGIAKYSVNRLTSSRLLLVELRLKYRGQGQNSRTSDMKSKEEHTRSLLVDYPLDTRSFFIFNKDVAPHKRSTINRKSQVDSKLKCWVILSPEEFINQFRFVEVQYEPESPIESIRKDGIGFVNDDKFDRAIELVDYWLSKVDHFYNQYKLEECKVLLSVLREILDAVRCKNKSLSQDNILDVLIAEEGVSKFRILLS